VMRIDSADEIMSKRCATDVARINLFRFLEFS